MSCACLGIIAMFAAMHFLTYYSRKDYPIPVIDVRFQRTLDVPWTMAQWVEYITTPFEKRHKVLNSISLEVSGTDLGDIVGPHRFFNTSATPLGCRTQDCP